MDWAFLKINLHAQPAEIEKQKLMSGVSDIFIVKKAKTINYYLPGHFEFTQFPKHPLLKVYTDKIYRQISRPDTDNSSFSWNLKSEETLKIFSQYQVVKKFRSRSVSLFSRKIKPRPMDDKKPFLIILDELTQNSFFKSPEKTNRKIPGHTSCSNMPLHCLHHHKLLKFNMRYCIYAKKLTCQTWSGRTTTHIATGELPVSKNKD